MSKRDNILDNCNHNKHEKCTGVAWSEPMQDEFYCQCECHINKQSTEATHKISAVYFPGREEVELSFENIETGRSISLITKVSPETGKRIAEIVPPCVYHSAVINDK